MAARASPKSRIIRTLDVAYRRTRGRDINNRAIAANAPRSVRVPVEPSEANNVMAKAPPNSSDVAESSTRTGAGIGRADRAEVRAEMLVGREEMVALPPFRATLGTSPTEAFWLCKRIENLLRGD